MFYPVVKPKIESQSLQLPRSQYSPSRVPVSLSEKKTDCIHLNGLNSILFELNKIPQNNQIQADEGAINKPLPVTSWTVVNGLQTTAFVLLILVYELLSSPPKSESISNIYRVLSVPCCIQCYLTSINPSNHHMQ